MNPHFHLGVPITWKPMDRGFCQFESRSAVPCEVVSDSVWHVHACVSMKVTLNRGKSRMRWKA
jgi:hypothetical protein